MNPGELIQSFRNACESHGLDLAVPFVVQRYNESRNEKHPPLETFGRQKTVGILVGNTKKLWPVFTEYAMANREVVENSEHPLDEYVAKCICDEAVKVGSKFETYYPSSTGEKFVHFQKLGEDLHFAYLNKVLYLSIHPVYGPWFAYRGVIVFDMDFDVTGISEMWPSDNQRMEDPYPECHEVVEARMKEYLRVAGGYENRTGHYELLVAARNAGTKPSARAFEYSPLQTRYHYTRDKNAIFSVSH